MASSRFADANPSFADEQCFLFLLVAVAVQQVGIAATSLVIGLIPVMVPVLGRRDQHAAALQAIIAADDGYHCWCGAD